MKQFSPFLESFDEAWAWANAAMLSGDTGYWYSFKVYSTRKLHRWRVRVTKAQSSFDGPVFSRDAIALITGH